ncbi:hypothetical protein [Neisseria sicca]|nr:hypothetical protein [Neisseria sicca]
MVKYDAKLNNKGRLKEISDDLWCCWRLCCLSVCELDGFGLFGFGLMVF